MGHQNYSKFSQFKKTEDSVNEEIKEVVEEAVNEIVEQNSEAINEVAKPAVENIEQTVVSVNVEVLPKGIVNCERLNVRKGPSKDTEVLCVIKKDEEVMLFNEQIEPITREEFYKVCTASGIEGYCMKKFINVV